ncbi:hypothetical protein JOE26_000803 [Rhodococcus coprophilus]|uniref:Bacterial protein of uncharacterized function (DUF937) n=2 Tax=Rhodococcus coprophilus TaxID=38310 RepID=A0A2X4U9U8_9NOCA|nr:hypothetical protein [Rhodococcus coprophilus]SQI31172.1 Bacterial protein of uncharacterised function (DUF937) [Rhodococcus coprophilus]
MTRQVLMASLDELLSRIPIDSVAERLGVDRQTADTAVRAALPTLVGGLGANARNPEGAASLMSALDEHSRSGLLDGVVNVDKVDTDDGGRIVSNVFGEKKDQVISTLGTVNGSGGSTLVADLLPILAPIVLSYLAEQIKGAGASASGGEPREGGALGDLLGGLLEGASGRSGGGGGGIGDILGSVLGGSSGGGLGGLLGGLLGGGKR